MTELYMKTFSSLIGTVHIFTHEKQMVSTCLSDSLQETERFLQKNFGKVRVIEEPQPYLNEYADQINDYLSGALKKFTIPYTIYATPFRTKVLETVAEIPYGQVLSYKDVGVLVGTAGYRAVGSAMRTNPLPIIIPCHRVIGSNNSMGGYSMGNGLETKKLLLRMENRSLFV